MHLGILSMYARRFVKDCQRLYITLQYNRNKLKKSIAAIKAIYIIWKSTHTCSYEGYLNLEKYPECPQPATLPGKSNRHGIVCSSFHANETSLDRWAHAFHRSIRKFVMETKFDSKDARGFCPLILIGHIFDPAHTRHHTLAD